MGIQLTFLNSTVLNLITIFPVCLVYNTLNQEEFANSRKNIKGWSISLAMISVGFQGELSEILRDCFWRHWLHADSLMEVWSNIYPLFHLAPAPWIHVLVLLFTDLVQPPMLSLILLGKWLRSTVALQNVCFCVYVAPEQGQQVSPWINYGHPNK